MRIDRERLRLFITHLRINKAADEETLTDADNFSAVFPKEMDLKGKKMILAAIFLIDSYHFEHRRNLQ